MLKHRWEGDIRIDMKEIGGITRNWMDSAHDMDYWRALGNTKLDLWVS